MVRFSRMMLGTGVLLLVVGGPLLYAAHRQVYLRNFRVVEPGVLVRSGQLTRPGLERVLRDYRIKAGGPRRASGVPNGAPPDTWEAEVCAGHGAKRIGIVPRVWSPDEKGGVPAEDAI